MTDTQTRGIIDGFRARLGIRRQVRLMGGDDRAVPFAIGLLRPVVYVPEVLLRPEARRGLEAALAHELGHVARGDALALVLLRVVQSLYFFHPLVWLVGHRLHDDRERLCDRLVVASRLLPARRYLDGLLQVLGLGLQPVAAPALLMHGSKRRIVMRLRGLLSESHLGRPRSFAALVGATLIGSVLLPLAGAEPRETVAPPASRGATLACPITKGRVSAGFGEWINPLTSKVDFHRGIDVAAPRGQAILAVSDGTVEVATENDPASPGAGRVVVLDHGAGLKTFYSHLDSFDVRPGDRVVRGARIGGVGSTGRSTGPHLHFEVWRDGNPVDPTPMISSWPR